MTNPNPYHGNSGNAKAWQQGYDDAKAGRKHNSGNPWRPASETLAYNQGWRAAQVAVR